MIRSEIRLPLLNANEPEARLVGIHAKDGQVIQKGTRLFTVETTKAASDIDSPEAGYLRILTAEGVVLAVGDVLAVITDTKDEKFDIPDLQKPQRVSFETDQRNAKGLRITKPARILAEKLGVDLAALPGGRLITEDIVRQIAGAQEEIALPPNDKAYILVYGAGGHAKSVMEIIRQSGEYAIAGIIDDDATLTNKKVIGIPVLGTRSLLSSLADKGVKLAANGVGGILDINIRVKVFQLLEASGFIFPALIHPRAAIEPSAMIEDGVQVFANAYVGSETRLHSRSMINTNAVISHDCEIGEYTHIAPGALLAGHVKVGSRSLVGMGVTTAIGVHIGDGVRIGNGANILADVPDRSIIQAGRFWTGKAE